MERGHRRSSKHDHRALQNHERDLLIRKLAAKTLRKFSDTETGAGKDEDGCASPSYFRSVIAINGKTEVLAEEEVLEALLAVPIDIPSFLGGSALNPPVSPYVQGKLSCERNE